MAKPRTYDLVCIGGGSAGFNAARVAADLGWKVAIVDGAEELGGLCILRGCMPSKTLLYAAEYGYVKVLAEPKRGRILGAEIVGKDAGELIHCFAIALAQRANVFDLLRAPWYHPTLAEILTYPLEEIADQIGR